MRLTTTTSAVALVALLGQAATAAYTVTLYPKPGCKYNNALTKSGGYRCKSIGANQCCSDGNFYHSAKFKEVGAGSGGCDDELKIYQFMGDEPCGLPTAQSAHTKCASSDSLDVAGAKVVVVINPGGGGGGGSGRWSGRRRRDLQQPAKTVAPSQYVFENGTETHVLDLDSVHGRALQLLARDEDKVDYVVRYGTVEPTDNGLQKRACGGSKPPAKPTAKPAGKPAGKGKPAPPKKGGRV